MWPLLTSLQGKEFALGPVGSGLLYSFSIGHRNEETVLRVTACGSLKCSDPPVMGWLLNSRTLGGIEKGK